VKPLIDQAAALEAAQDATEVAGIQAQILAEFGCRRPIAVRQLVQHPRLGGRKQAPQKPLLQQPDLAGVKAIEAAHGSHAAAELLGRHGSPDQDPCHQQRVSRLFRFPPMPNSDRGEPSAQGLR
jgi:hypothetical protein